MQPRAPYARLGHRKIIVGLTILVAIGLVSVYKYYSRQEWGGELQQSTALEHGASELADQNRLMEQIYQVSHQKTDGYMPGCRATLQTFPRSSPRISSARNLNTAVIELGNLGNYSS